MDTRTGEEREREREREAERGEKRTDRRQLRRRVAGCALREYSSSSGIRNWPICLTTFNEKKVMGPTHTRTQTHQELVVRACFYCQSAAAGATLNVRVKLLLHHGLML